MVKIVLYYNQAQGGWTEVFYTTATAINPDPANDSAFQGIFRAAINLRAPGTQLYGVRQTVLNTIPLQSLFVPLGNQYILPFTSTREADVKSTDALVFIYNREATLKRPMYIRGLQDNDTVRSQQFTDTPTAGLKTKLNDYITLLINFGAGIQKLDRTLVAPFDARGVSLLTANASVDNYTDLLMSSSNVALVAGVPLIMTGRPRNDAPGLPRITVSKGLSNGNTVVTIPYRLRKSGVSVSPIKMTVRQLKYTVDPMYSWSFWRFSEHKTGRPFGVLRGRTSAVVKAQ